MDTLSPFFWEKMIGSVSSSFTDLVTIGQRLEEGIKNGKVSKAAESSGVKKSFGNFQKKKEEVNVDSTERRRPRQRAQYYDQPFVAAVAPVIKTPSVQTPQAVVQNQNRNRARFDPIPMSYTELYPAMVQRGLITTRSLTPLNPLPSGLRSDLHCEFHQGAAGHDLENCYALKTRVQELIKAKILTFKDAGANVIDNLLPGHDK